MWIDAVCGTAPLPPELPLTSTLPTGGRSRRPSGSCASPGRSASCCWCTASAAPPRAPPGPPAGAGAISTAMIAITTSSSISVNPRRFRAHESPSRGPGGEGGPLRGPRRPLAGIEVAEHAGVFGGGGPRRRVFGAEDAPGLVGGLAVERLGLVELALEPADQPPVGQGRHVVGMLRPSGAADAALVLVGQRLGLGEPAAVDGRAGRGP